ncbi:MAG: sugar transferase [candidate division WOR-3 bacterium]|nr:sugar transferase [candidate division WOR-3 bacterium]
MEVLTESALNTTKIREIEVEEIIEEPFAKRVFDIVFSGLGLILSSWLWALIWIGIWCEDGSPVCIRQFRIGKNGKLFKVIKFRSMRKNSLNEKINIQAKENDPRITIMGKILRKTAFDELPQLLNIFLGDMSFVGPRALLPAEIEINDTYLHVWEIPGYYKRIKIRPGLTGIAQIFAPRDLPRRHKFKYDLLYIRKMSLLLDLKLILLSFLITFKGTWERKRNKLKFLKVSKWHLTGKEI